ncbi:arsenate reductase (glutaredoxin) [Vogesella oryzae]|uniref:arsenate reductase (glutaredoxin) n=1 Tax=Vogesella oryzae TaxID=1735285 RepID=UPI0015840086|nr:arsenate reductase (glutaredoxin) [Vogesella oryzae]
MLRYYHNPRCSKSREGLQLLQERGAELQVIEYLKTPPSADELRRILALLGISARALLRSKEEEFQTLGLADAALDDEALIAAMVAHPRLIERPIAVGEHAAAIGRPPENLLALL